MIYFLHWVRSTINTLHLFILAQSDQWPNYTDLKIYTTTLTSIPTQQWCFLCWVWWSSHLWCTFCLYHSMRLQPSFTPTTMAMLCLHWSTSPTHHKDGYLVTFLWEVLLKNWGNMSGYLNCHTLALMDIRLLVTKSQGNYFEIY